MVREVLACAPDPGRPLRVLDGTFGRGGHARALIGSRPVELYLAMDRDRDAVRAAEALASELAGGPTRLRARHGDFAGMRGFLADEGGAPLDLVLLDLGVSTPQLEDPARGFSFLRPGPLDMRMDTSRGPTAAALVAGLGEKELADLIFRFGEERLSRRIARAVVERRRRAPITDSADLAAIIAAAVGRHGRLHPATRSFQALRIAVNGELGSLERAMAEVPSCLGPGGRIVTIAFHSLEDRIVKQACRGWAAGGLGTILTRHCRRPDEAEVRSNPRARSARLRCFERAA